MARFVDVHPDNPQPRLIAQVADAVRRDELIAYPTDSGYALGSRLGNRAGRDRIVAIRELDDKAGEIGSIVDMIRLIAERTNARS